MNDPLLSIPGLGGFLAARDRHAQQQAQQMAQAASLAGLLHQQEQMQMARDVQPFKIDVMRGQAQEARLKADRDAAVEAAINALPEDQRVLARIAPAQYVSGLNKNPMESMPDPVRIQEWIGKFRKQNTPESNRRADQLEGILTRRAEGDKENTRHQLMAQGYSEDVARGIAYGFMKFVPMPDGSMRMVRVDQALGGQVPQGQGAASSGMGATPSSSPGQPTQSQSPYQPQPRLPGEVGGSSGSKPAAALYQDVQELSKRVTDAKIPSLDASMESLDRIFNKYEPGKLPGVGYGLTGSPVAGVVYGAGSALNIPGAQEAQDVRGQLKRWTNIITRASAGLSQTVTETANVLAETMTKPGASETDVRTAYENWKRAYMNERASAFAGADPHVVSEFYRRQGKKALFYAPTDSDAAALARSLEAQGIRNFEVKISNESPRFASGKVTESSAGPAPEGVDPKVWGAMTPEERKLWQR